MAITMVKGVANQTPLVRGIKAIQNIFKSNSQSAFALFTTANAESAVDEYILLLEFDGKPGEEHMGTIILNDGTRITEADMENDDRFTLVEELQSDYLRAYYIRESLDEISQWTFEVESIEGEITPTLYEFVPPLEVEAKSIATKANGSFVFNTDSATAAPDATVSIYLDDDNSGFDGFSAHTTTLAELQNGWTPEGVPAGTYYVYIRVECGDAVPEMVYFNVPITVTDPTQLSAAEYAAIRSQYADLGLSANMADYNVSVVTADQLSEAALRNAVNAAAITTANDLIVLRTTNTQNTITLGGTELLVNAYAPTRGSVTIVSFGAEPLSIDANQQSRVISVRGDAVVALAGLTMTGGKADYGGGIHSSGVVTVTNCAISGNSANYIGGGIYNLGGAKLTVTNSQISENSARITGGGINNGSYGIVTITDSTISKNSAHSGGGIYNDANGILKIIDSTFSGNSANYGGGIYNRDAGDSSGVMTITNSTISGNTAEVNAGGVLNLGGWRVTGSTISGNTALEFPEYSNIYDGGYELVPPTAPPNLVSTARTSNSVTLGWTAQSGLTGYSLQYKKSGEAAWMTWTPAPETSADRVTVTGLAANTAYDFQLTATNLLGSASSTVDATTQPAVLTPSAALKAPTKPKVAIGSQSVVLSWAAAANATGYKIEWYTGKTLLGSTEITGGANVSTTIPELKAGTKHSFKIYTTTDDGLISQKYVGVSATTKTAPAPQSVKAKADGMRAVSITWKAPKNSAVPVDLVIAGYGIYDSQGNLIGTANAGETSFRCEGLLPKTSYSFKIVAIYQPKSGGETLESGKPVKVKAKTATFLAPKAVKTVTGDADLTSLTLRWQVHPDADGFNITCLQKKAPVTLDFGDGGNASFVYGGNSGTDIIGVTITGLSPGLKYDFTVRATNSDLGMESAVLKKSVSTLKFPSAKKPVKALLTSSSVQVGWASPVLPKGVEGGILYHLYYTTTKGLKPGEAGWTVITSWEDEHGVKWDSSGVISGLASDQTYYFYVRAFWNKDATVFSNSKILQLKTLKS